MPRDRRKALERLLSGALPYPKDGKTHLVDAPEDFIVQEALDAVGADRLVLIERHLRVQRKRESRFPSLDCRHAAEAEPAPGDFVVLPISRHRQGLYRELRNLCSAVGPEGTLALYGTRKEGIVPAQELLEHHAQLLRVEHRGGGRLLVFHPSPDSDDWGLEDLPADFLAVAGDLRAHVSARPGVFSWDRLDAASSLMLMHAVPREGDRLLDLGCGNGVLAALLLSGGNLVSATLTDSNALALETARKTLELNDLEGQVIASDSGDSLPDRGFDLILCNPPYRKGLGRNREPGRHMIAEAARLLAPKGRFYLVGPQFHDHGSQLESRFAHWKELPGSSSYRVWLASHPRTRQP